jgi:hypothetical protein
VADGRIEQRGGVLGIGFGLAGVVLGLVASGVLGPDRWRDQIVLAIALAAFATALGLGWKMRLLGLVVFAPFFLLIGVASAFDVGEASPRWIPALIAAGMVLSGGGAVLSVLVAARKSKELDRLLLSESTSVAFFLTMLASLTYALLESWVDAPPLSLWNVWTFGMLTWIATFAILGRRYS